MMKEVNNWLDLAKRDFNAAKGSFNTQNFEWACFQMQQSVEKALKAILILKENKIIKTHDLVFLADKVNLPSEFKEICKELTLIYLSVRYPDSAEIKNIKQKAEKYLNLVEEILQWTEKQV